MGGVHSGPRRRFCNRGCRVCSCSMVMRSSNLNGDRSAISSLRMMIGVVRPVHLGCISERRNDVLPQVTRDLQSPPMTLMTPLQSIGSPSSPIVGYILLCLPGRPLEPNPSSALQTTKDRQALIAERAALSSSPTTNGSTASRHRRPLPSLLCLSTQGDGIAGATLPSGLSHGRHESQMFAEL